jgi:hypothetical protein
MPQHSGTTNSCARFSKRRVPEISRHCSRYSTREQRSAPTQRWWRWAAQPVLIGGRPGAVWMHDGAVRVAFHFAVVDDRITAIELVGEPATIALSVIER